MQPSFVALFLLFRLNRHNKIITLKEHTGISHSPFPLGKYKSKHQRSKFSCF